MFEKVNEIDTTFVLIKRALTFITGYDIYVCTVTVRIVGIIMGAHANIHIIKGHRILAVFDFEKYVKVQSYYRIGTYANAIRFVID